MVELLKYLWVNGAYQWRFDPQGLELLFRQYGVVIYTNDIEQIKTDLSELTAPESGYPIEIVADEDPDWDTFKKVNQAIQ